MTFDPQNIGAQFAASQTRYSQNAAHQRHCAQTLAAQLAPHLPAAVNQMLEIGCGTGFLTQALEQASDCSIKTYYLNDLYQPALPAKAHQKYLIGDITALPLPQPLDVAVSSSALQWIEPLPALIARLADAMNSRGKIALSMYCGSHYQELKTAAGIGLPYHSPAALTELFQAYFRPLHTEELTETLYFPSARVLLTHIRATGAATLAAGFAAKRRLPAGLEAQRNSSGIPLTYHALQFIGEKP